MKSHHFYRSIAAVLCACASNGCNSGDVISYAGEKCEPECGAQALCCAGACADIRNDAYNCGQCWNQCRNNQICDDGACKDRAAAACVPECAAGEQCCAGACADLKTDPNNCGVCGNACPEGVACAGGSCDAKPPCECESGKVCNDDGDCVESCGGILCAVGEQCCGDVCSALDSVADCGACGNACPEQSPYCKDGQCADACVPSDCAAANAQCGKINDGCGTILECGACESGKVCNANQCADACVPTTCENMQKNCGFIDDGCGNSILCGTCDEKTQICNNNICIDRCAPTTCEALNNACGTIDDGCAATIDCGACPSGQICKNNACVSDATPCVPVTCEAKGKNCGAVDDGCGNALNCGACSGTETCVGNVCSEPPCAATTCAAAGKNCGTIGDGCGNELNCGSCAGSQECRDNVCKDPDCAPKTCASAGKNCGSISDGCGKTLQCGACSDAQNCENNVCADKPVAVRDTYPVRKSIKGLQPDWQDRNQIIGNEVHGVAMNLVWAEWQPSQTSSCGSGQVLYDGYCFSVNSSYADAIRDYTNHGIVVTAVIYGVPAWARRSCAAGSVIADIFCAPADGKQADYGRFAGFLAYWFNGENGNGRIADFVIHNEVNNYKWFNPGCSGAVASCPLDAWTTVYANSYNAAYDAVRKEQKNAKVLISFDHYFGQSENNNKSYRVDSFLQKLVPKLGNRDWMLAFHSYPPNLTNPAFGANDYSNNGIISFGNIGVLAGWLRKNYPNDSHAWEIQLTENGINGVNSSMQSQQSAQLCQAFRNILGTPGVSSFIYHRLVDHPDETKDGLGCGLWNADKSQKPAWTTFALANRSGVAPKYPACGFEDLPYARLYRGFGTKHWVTSRQFPSGVTTERSWKILRQPDSKATAVMVYECRVGGAAGDHTMISPDVGCENQFSMGPMGYVYTTQVAGTVALYRCRNDLNGDHLITDQASCEGYTKESLIGYVYPG